MKKILYYSILFILLFLNSCNNDKANEKILIKRSKDYFIKKRININSFKSNYYFISNEKVGYKHYVLRYYKVIRNDSLIVWFTIDDNGDYFIQLNNNFYK